MNGWQDIQTGFVLPRVAPTQLNLPNWEESVLPDNYFGLLARDANKNNGLVSQLPRVKGSNVDLGSLMAMYKGFGTPNATESGQQVISQKPANNGFVKVRNQQAASGTPLDVQGANSFEDWYKRMRKWEGGKTIGRTEGLVVAGMNKWDLPYMKDYNGDGRVDVSDLEHMPLDEHRRISRTKYWDKSLAGKMSNAVAPYYADFQFMSGRAPTVLRRTLNQLGGNFKTGKNFNFVDDSVVNFMNGLDQRQLLDALHTNRLNYYKGLRDWDVYGNGWTNRLNDFYNAGLGYL